jgi:hypothetical protein
MRRRSWGDDMPLSILWWWWMRRTRQGGVQSRTALGMSLGEAVWRGTSASKSAALRNVGRVADLAAEERRMQSAVKMVARGCGARRAL